MIKKNIKYSQKYAKILGINVLVTSMDQVLTSVKEKISHNEKFYITTPNPELVLASTKDKKLREVLNSSDLAIPDGIGLAQAVRFNLLKAPNNIFLRVPTLVLEGLLVGGATFFNQKYLTGVLPILKGKKVFDSLIRLANDNGWKVFLLGGEADEAKVSQVKIKNTYKNIEIESFKGPKVNNDGLVDLQIDIDLQKDAVDKINKFNPDLLFVAMGNPRQEKWVYNNLKDLKVRGVMCVGGTFRYLSGVSKSSPELFENLGLEWFWRLLTEPYRLVRIFNAVVLFPLKVFSQKLYNTSYDSRKG